MVIDAQTDSARMVQNLVNQMVLLRPKNIVWHRFFHVGWANSVLIVCICTIDKGAFAQPDPPEVITALEELDAALLVPDFDHPDLAIRFVALSGRHVTDSALVDLRKLESLRQITIQGSNITDAGLKNLVPCQRLQVLTIRRRAITAHALHHISLFPDLRQLVLADCDLRGRDFASIVKLRGLQKISLERCQLGDDALCHLGSLSNVEILYLPGNHFTDSGAAFLSKLKMLRVLNLDGSKVTEEALASIPKANLDTLSLASTDVSGDPERLLASVCPETRLGLSGWCFFGVFWVRRVAG